MLAVFTVLYIDSNRTLHSFILKWIQASFIHQPWFVKPHHRLPPPFPRLHPTDKPDRSQKDKYILSLDLIFIKT